jgi:aminopeptidase N
LKELALTLPSESMIGEQLPVYDPAAVHRARVFVRTALARGLAREWLATYRANQPTGSYSPEARAVGQRSLRNVCLSYLMELGDEKLHQLAWQQFKSADNMTDRIEALAALVNVPAQQRERALERYAKIFRDDPLALDKWLRVQAVARRVDAPVLEAVQKLTRHRAFSLRTPNKVYSLLGAFFSGNPSEFHREDGAGYAFWADQVLAVDRINPSVAGRLARALDRWKKLTPPLQAAAKRALARVHGADALSPDVAEIVGKALRA